MTRKSKWFNYSIYRRCSTRKTRTENERKERSAKTNNKKGWEDAKTTTEKRTKLWARKKVASAAAPAAKYVCVVVSLSAVTVCVCVRVLMRAKSVPSLSFSVNCPLCVSVCVCDVLGYFLFCFCSTLPPPPPPHASKRCAILQFPSFVHIAFSLSIHPSSSNSSFPSCEVGFNFCLFTTAAFFPPVFVWEEENWRRTNAVDVSAKSAEEVKVGEGVNTHIERPRAEHEKRTKTAAAAAMVYLYRYGRVPRSTCTTQQYAHVCKTLQESEWALRLQSHTHRYCVWVCVPCSCSCIQFFPFSLSSKRNQFRFDSIWFLVFLHPVAYIGHPALNMRLKHEHSDNDDIHWAISSLFVSYKWYTLGSKLAFVCFAFVSLYFSISLFVFCALKSPSI